MTTNKTTMTNGVNLTAKKAKENYTKLMGCSFSEIKDKSEQNRLCQAIVNEYEIERAAQDLNRHLENIIRAAEDARHHLHNGTIQVLNSCGLFQGSIPDADMAVTKLRYGTASRKMYLDHLK